MLYKTLNFGHCLTVPCGLVTLRYYPASFFGPKNPVSAQAWSCLSPRLMDRPWIIVAALFPSSHLVPSSTAPNWHPWMDPGFSLTGDAAAEPCYQHPALPARGQSVRTLFFGVGLSFCWWQNIPYLQANTCSILGLGHTLSATNNLQILLHVWRALPMLSGFHLSHC